MAPSSEPAVAAPLSRTDRRRRQARSRLIAAARELIAQKGVEGLRLREIAELADISAGQFYSHFENKELLVEAVITESIETRAAAFVAVCDTVEDPLEAVSVAHRCFVRLAYDEPEIAWLMVKLERADALFSSALWPYGARTFARGLRASPFPPQDPDVLMTAFVGATVSVMRGVLDGRLGPGADIASAQGCLRSLGVPDPLATEIVHRPLPAVPARAGTPAAA